MPTKRFSSIKPSPKRQSRSQAVIPLRTAKSTCQVTLLLAAGHQYQFALSSDDPLLHQLFQVMLAKTQSQNQGAAGQPQLLQIPVQQGQASLCISSADLIGIVTEPALFIKPHAASAQPRSQDIAPQPSAPAVIQPNSESILPARFVQLEPFLSAADHAKALEIALNQADNFVASTTTTAADNYRQSSILYATYYTDFYQKLRLKILETLPTILQQLQMPEFQISEVEMQMTAHNDGCFYKIHNDSGHTPTRTRQLTYVYYFHQTPQAFSGGELKIYDTELQQNGPKARAISQTVTPKNNSIIFFDSRLMHEVLPIVCPSRVFDHSRFTLNGWLRRAEPSSN